MNARNTVTVRIWGDLACFTRPEMKVERVSYPIMTPSAARGCLEAIFWEPQMYYWIHEIAVVKRGRWIAFKRNEVKKVISMSSAKTWMNRPDKFVPIQAGGGAEDAAQRNTLALGDVEYLVTAEVRLSRLAKPPKDNVPKYWEEVRRRAAKGKCYHRPSLGCREFAADFETEEDATAALTRRTAALGTTPEQSWSEEDLGLVLYDVFDPLERDAGFAWYDAARPCDTALSESEVAAAAGQDYFGRMLRPCALLFKARVQSARMDCHPERVEILRDSSVEG